MGRWLRLVAYLLRQSRNDAELREEIETHRALRTAHLERGGLTPDQADGASRRAIGNVLLAREDARDVWLGAWPTWWQDIRYGLRTFRRNPLFTAVAVVTLALGIGVNTGIVTVLNGVLFRDLPAPNAHELVSIQQTVEGGRFTAPTESGTFTISEYRAYRDRTRTLSGVLAHSDPRETTLGGDAPQRIYGAIVSCNYFTVMQVTPVLGRPLIPQDCEPGADPVVVLGHAVWTTAFAADRAVVGRTVELDRQRFTVVGVAAEGMYGGSPLVSGYFAPLSADPLLWSGAPRYQDERFRWLYLIGRRSDGTVLDRVRAELGVIASQIDRQESGRSTSLAIQRATRIAVPPGMRAATTGAAAVVMAAFALATVGIYGVVSFAVGRRRREIGIRLALGASAPSVLGAMLRQTMRPVIVGAVIGVGAASATSRTLSGALFGVSPADPVGLGGAAVLVLGVAVAAGVVAARPATRVDPTVALRSE